jgi:3-methyladenine DNA glycosylase/8-oxoguanine DNA glycosylase
VVAPESFLDGRRDLRAVLGPLRRGMWDPALVLVGDREAWLAGQRPEGSFTARLTAVPDGVEGTFWGEGAQWAAGHLPDMLGAADDPVGFEPAHELVASMWRRHRPTWAVPRTLLTWQVALAAVLEQRVTGVQARRAWAGLLRDHGTPAPGPTPRPMRVPPTPEAVLRVPSWDWRRYDVDRQRVLALREVSRAQHVLRRAELLPPGHGREALRVLPGVGAWTAAEISARAFGDADSVSVGDYHLAANVVFALTGRTGGTDEQMLALLAPYAGHRYRAVRMIEMSGVVPPRRGPRMALPGPRG